MCPSTLFKKLIINSRFPPPANTVVIKLKLYNLPGFWNFFPLLHYAFGPTLSDTEVPKQRVYCRRKQQMCLSSDFLIPKDKWTYWSIF